MNNILAKIRRFIAGTIAELNKCTWPEKPELFEQTLLVIVAVLILAVFVAGVDQVSIYLINLITRT